MMDNARFDFKLEVPAKTLHSCIMQSEEQIKEAMQLGVDQAIKEAPELIMNKAREQAREEILCEVERYFKYGPGGRLIFDVVNGVLTDIFSKIDLDTKSKEGGAR